MITYNSGYREENSTEPYVVAYNLNITDLELRAKSATLFPNVVAASRKFRINLDKMPDILNPKDRMRIVNRKGTFVLRLIPPEAVKRIIGTGEMYQYSLSRQMNINDKLDYNDVRYRDYNSGGKFKKSKKVEK